jgi:glycosyltransferase involved in cell wall biosynthesis
MDRANAAVADHLVARGHPVELVGNSFDERFSDRDGLRVHRVPRPAGSFLLGDALLHRHGRAVAGAATRRDPSTRVLVNGGNCVWPDINWVHSVHRAWPIATDGAPAWYRLKARAAKAWARWRERLALDAASVILANSEKTRRDIVTGFGVAPNRVHTVYLGADPDWGDVAPDERARARHWLSIPSGVPVVAFVGALSYDRNKGFDALWRAWQRLCAHADWDGVLVAAGGGNGVGAWRSEVARAGMSGRARLLGFTDRVDQLLAAADILVSPVRYEAYGLNVQEAICRGLPAMVSASAGIAERYPPELSPMLLVNPADDADIARRLIAWRRERDAWRRRFQPLAEQLRHNTWRAMAARVVEVAERNGR